MDEGPQARTFDQGVAARRDPVIVGFFESWATFFQGEPRETTLSMAGGKTPRRVYGALATHHATASFWSLLHVFWGDERCVPPGESGQRLLFG